MKRRQAVFLTVALLLLSACSSTNLTEGDLVSKLPTLQQISTVENAERGLVISQQIRVLSRDGLAKRVLADGAITDAERAQIETFDKYDTFFTDAWRVMDRAVTVWKLTGERSPEIDKAYADLLNAILKPHGLRDLPPADGGDNGGR